MGYPFVVSESVRVELGDTALRELQRNLHPRDCQACGRLLNDAPSLVVDDLGSVVSAALYHSTCRASEYRTASSLAVDGAWLSYDVVAAVLSVLLDDGTDLAMPMVMINPSLEQVVLRRNPLGLWTCGTVAHFRAAGLQGIDVHRPVPGARAEFVQGSLRVWVGATGEQYWDCPTNTLGLREHAQARGGVAVALTTAHVPTNLFARSVEDFARALDSEDVATGWVTLSS